MRYIESSPTSGVIFGVNEEDVEIHEEALKIWLSYNWNFLDLVLIRSIIWPWTFFYLEAEVYNKQ